MRKKIFLFLSLFCFISVIILYLYGRTKYNQPLEQPTEVVIGHDFNNTLEYIDLEVVTQDMVQEEVVRYQNVLEIPSLDILVNVYDEVSLDLLQKGVCRYESTSVLGGQGLTVLCGHSSNRWEYVFNPLKNISNDANIYIWDAGGKKHTYIVTKIFKIEPTETWILKDDTDFRNKIRIFCCSDNGAKRLVVEALEVEEKDLQILKQNLLAINDSIEVPSVYLELLNFGKETVNMDNSLPTDFYLDFGIYIKERSK